VFLDQRGSFDASALELATVSESKAYATRSNNGSYNK
jgi:hypothetical protein